MILRTKIRKLQSGAALDQAKNAAAPVDIRWKQFDMSEYKPTPLNIPPGDAYGAAGGSSVEGLPSDISFVNDKLNDARQQLRDGLTGPDSTNFANSPTFKNISDEVNRWSMARATMLKTREDNFKSTKTKLEKATSDDLAMYGGYAVVKDNSDGSTKLVNSNDVLTARITDGKKISPRYSPMTVGDALNIRYSDPTFSGFTEEGTKLDGILNNVMDSDTIYKTMDDVFRRAGQASEDNKTFTTTGGSTLDSNNLLGSLDRITTLSQTGIKSNEKELQNAVNVFKADLTPTQLESLRNKAMVKFNELNGNQNVAPAVAKEWVNNRIDGLIAERASIYLRQSNIKISGTKTAGTESGTALDKQKIDINRIAASRMLEGEKKMLETKVEGADALNDKTQNTMADARVNVLPGWSESVDFEAKELKNVKNPEQSYLLSANPFISRLTGGELRRNLFLLDGNSTPVAQLNNNDGLNNAIPNITESAKIVQNMPVIEDANGNKRIAWDRVNDAIKWGKAFKEESIEKIKSLGEDPSSYHLSNADRMDIINKLRTKLGFDMSELSRGVRSEDVAMLPILVADSARPYDDPLASVMSSDLTPEEKALADKMKLKSRHLHKTFAFSVLDSGPLSMANDAYGKSQMMDKSINVGDFLKSAIASSRARFDFVPVASGAAASTLDVSQQQ